MQRHYLTVAEWWHEHHGVGFLPPECLPRFGCVAHDIFDPSGPPLAACFTYLTDAKIAFVAFLVADPALGPKTWFFASSAVLEAARAAAQTHLAGEGFIQIVTHSPAFRRLAVEHCGFEDGGSMLSAFRLEGSNVDWNAIT